LKDIASQLQIYDELLHQGQQKEDLSLFLTYVVPYLKEESVKLEPPAFRTIADVAYIVTTAADNPNFVSLFKHFGLSEKVNIRYIYNYAPKSSTKIIIN